MHIVATPVVAFFALIAWRSVAQMRAPEQPSGWPRAMAPPFTFTFSSMTSRRPRSFRTGSDCAAKASLSSQRSTSPAFMPIRAKAFFVAGTGP